MYTNNILAQFSQYWCDVKPNQKQTNKNYNIPPITDPFTLRWSPWYDEVIVSPLIHFDVYLAMFSSLSPNVTHAINTEQWYMRTYLDIEIFFKVKACVHRLVLLPWHNRIFGISRKEICVYFLIILFTIIISY